MMRDSTNLPMAALIHAPTLREADEDVFPTGFPTWFPVKSLGGGD
jgi:hypothetical protein